MPLKRVNAHILCLNARARVCVQAALAPDQKASGTSVLSVSVGAIKEKFVLCHLTPGTCDQWSLDIGFAPEDGEVLFHLTGKQSMTY